MKIIEHVNLSDKETSKTKSKYINTLLRAGFDTIDISSVGADIIDNLYMQDIDTKLQLEINNVKDFNKMKYIKEIKYIKFPFSLSEKFLKMTTEQTFKDSMDELEKLVEESSKYNKEIIIYLSMGFGNVYDESWDIEYLLDIIDLFYELGIGQVFISDTLGLSTPESIEDIFTEIQEEFDDMIFGFHLHTPGKNWYNKLKKSYEMGIYKYDGSLNSANNNDFLMDNLNTNNIIDFCFDNNIENNINKEWFDKSVKMSKQFKNENVIRLVKNEK